MKLILTEKPSVARQFEKALGVPFTKRNNYLESDEWLITWCVGHLIAMSYPEKYDANLKQWKANTLPFIPTTYKYEVIDKVKGQYETVTSLLNRDDVEVIYYAGDSAREGEYIQRLIREYGGRNENAQEKRIWVSSQTEEELLRGIREAKDLSEYDNLSDSGFLRAQEDYLFGINLSRILTIKYGEKFNIASGAIKHRPIAVGRVMTFVLGMIVERERLIRTTKETPFFGIRALLNDTTNTCDWKILDDSSLKGSPLLTEDGNNFAQKDDAEKQKTIFESVGALKLINSTTKNEKSNPKMLFDLAELQGFCSASFKISPDETLAIAQSLYEKQMVTYPRVDANVLSTAAAKEIHHNIFGLVGAFEDADCAIDKIKESASYKDIANTKYVNDSKITDHYAIIPTGKNAKMLSGLNALEKNVYISIVKRFLAIFLDAAEYETTTLKFACQNEYFIANSKVNTKLGFLELFGGNGDSEEKQQEHQVLKSLTEGADYGATFSVTEGKTGPPKPYTSGNLILAMKNAGKLIEDEELREQIKGDGIGTSATRAETVKKLIANEMIDLNKKTQVIRPRKSGEIMYDIIAKTVPSLLSAQMTASWEKGLSAVANGTVSREVYTEKINAYVATEVNQIKNNETHNSIDEALAVLKNFYSDIQIDTTENAMQCPLCSAPIKRAPWGYACNNYKDSCTFTVSREMYGRAIPENQLHKLITEGKTDLIKGFKKKDNSGTYNAKLQVDKSTGKISPCDFAK